MKLFQILSGSLFLCFCAFAQESGADKIVVSGFGENEDIALADAKQRLVSQILSEVSVTTQSTITKKGNVASSSFSQEAESKSEPITTPELNVEKKDCNGITCSISYSVSKTLWSKTLENELLLLLSKRNVIDAITEPSWSAFFIVSEAFIELEKAHNSIIALTNLSPEVADSLKADINEITEMLYIKSASLRVSVSSDKKELSNKVATTLVDSNLTDIGSTLTLFIRTTSKNAKQNDRHVAKATVELQLLDSQFAYSNGRKKTISKTAYSDRSQNDARSDAEEELLKQLGSLGLSGIF